MRIAKVVIGANWGDEGKGLLTDYYADADSLVIRFNGGAQAGHTVCAPDGRRHVFHHIGAGSLRGASTYLSRFFICNPLMFNEERYTLGTSPRVFVDPRAVITTPYDMMLNQMMEEARGTERHGSCGLGINETMVRSKHPEYRIEAAHDPSDHWLLSIRDKWVPQRLLELGLTPSEAWSRRVSSDAVIEQFVDAWTRFRDAVVISGGVVASWRGQLLFEGAQGLLLDQDHYFFPHVTHSHTGLTNVDMIARENAVDVLDVTYVTRAYTTRHGAGPFPGEDHALRFVDDTNMPNMWQGSLRFGWLSLHLLAESVTADLKRTTLPVRPQLGMTHVNDRPERLVLAKRAKWTLGFDVLMFHNQTRNSQDRL